MTDDLFGSKGIDTPYERELIEYHPELTYPSNQKDYQLDPRIIQQIERSKEFTITQNLFDYDDLIQNIQNLLDILNKRNTTKEFGIFKKALEDKQKTIVTDEENKLCGFDGSGDAEIYTLLYRMQASCIRRRGFLDNRYRTQITNKTDLDEVGQAESTSIDEWYQMQNQFIDLQNQLNQAQSDDEDNPVNESEVYIESDVVNQENTVNNKAALHTAMADTGYIHQNRTAIFNDLLNQFQILVSSPQILMPSDLKPAVMTLATGDLTSIKAHLILAFNQAKKDQNASKGRYVMLEDNKEDFISEQQWFHQQLENNVNSPLKNWLYNQADDNNAFNDLADILVGSLSQTQQTYQSSNNDILKFYQQEGAFYDTQILYIQKKEQIRQFLRIIEDLEDVNSITDEWATDYLVSKGYSVL